MEESKRKRTWEGLAGAGLFTVVVLGGLFGLARWESHAANAASDGAGAAAGQVSNPPSLDYNSLQNRPLVLSAFSNDLNYAQVSQIPTKVSQLTYDVNPAALTVAQTSFSPTVLLATGTYGPNSLSLATAQTGMAVACEVVNFDASSYVARGMVTAAGTIGVKLYVSQALTLNTTAPVVRCYAF